MSNPRYNDPDTARVRGPSALTRPSAGSQPLTYGVKGIARSGIARRAKQDSSHPWHGTLKPHIHREHPAHPRSTPSRRPAPPARPSNSVGAVAFQVRSRESREREALGSLFVEIIRAEGEKGEKFAQSEKNAVTQVFLCW